MSRGLLETLLGALVLLVGLGFAIMLFSSRLDHTGLHYDLKVFFDSAQGLEAQTDVRLGGVPIGYVEQVVLDQQTLQAVVHIKVRNDVILPATSRAEISTAGLLGDAFLNIIPGAHEGDTGNGMALLADGGEIRDTTPPVSLEDLLGKAIFALTKD